MNKKITWGLLSMYTLFALAQLAAQTVVPGAPTTSSLPVSEDSIIYAMFKQVFNNPSSLLVVAFLCVGAWLADDLPFINSRYVSHLTVILGGSIYWMFSSPASVPATFPHPYAVFVANGTLCGFLAFIIHKQVVARVINLVRGHTGDVPPVQPATQLKPNQQKDL